MTTETDAGPSRTKENPLVVTPKTSDQETLVHTSQPIASGTSTRRIFDDQSMHSDAFSFYSVQHRRRGTALIFNIEQFKYMSTRRGTDRDEMHLISCLEKLGFDIVVKEDLTADQIKEEIELAAQEDHSDADCFLCVFLTHGDDGVLHGCDSLTSKPETLVRLQDDVFDKFRGEKCTSLVGKPKIFIIQGVRQDDIISRKRRNTQESATYFFYQQPEYPKDCQEIYDQCEGQSADGVYLIKPEGFREPFEIYRNNSVDNEGWTVFQRRVDGSVDFYRNWKEYKNGFGFLRGEFWLGNDKIAYLTNQKTYELRIDLNNVNGQPYFAKYNLFRISDEGSKYRLVGLGDYNLSSTTTHDAMDTSRSQSFSTLDQDNDKFSDYSCATDRRGGWWYYQCGQFWANSLYDADNEGNSITWRNLPGDSNHIKYTEMKVRPLPQS